MFKKRNITVLKHRITRKKQRDRRTLARRLIRGDITIDQLERLAGPASGGVLRAVSYLREKEGSTISPTLALAVAAAVAPLSSGVSPAARRPAAPSPRRAAARAASAASAPEAAAEEGEPEAAVAVPEAEAAEPVAEARSRKPKLRSRKPKPKNRQPKLRNWKPRTKKPPKKPRLPQPVAGRRVQRPLPRRAQANPRQRPPRAAAHVLPRRASARCAASAQVAIVASPGALATKRDARARKEGKGERMTTQGNTFAMSPSYLYTSESVTEGHPDKVCDQVSDSILDAIYAQDPAARVACETATGTDFVAVLGEITTTAQVDYEQVVRDTLKRIGYDSAETGIDYRTCEVQVRLHAQSPDINQGVSRALEHRDTDEEKSEVEVLGAGDQGMMVGFACNETDELMPLTISLAHHLTRRLAVTRREGILPWLRPDGKSQVTVEYEFGKPKRVHTLVVSTQHDAEVSQEKIAEDVREHVINAVVPADLIDDQTRIFVNPSGRFVTGGPHGDAGLTGRKILVDTYGSVARHGGGAFSGKDPTKVDRSAAYAARWVAKNVVAAGLADRCEVQVSYAIGMAEPINVSVETFGTGLIPNDKIAELVDKHFDLRPGAIISQLGLRAPIYAQTASYGHFGRDDVDLPWERIDKADELRQDAGI